MNRGVMMIIVLLIYILYAAVKHKEVWKKLTSKQTIGVLAAFLIVTGICGSVLYYWTRFAADSIPSEIASLAVQYISAIIIVICGVVIFNMYASKITNGVLPIKKAPKR